MIWSLASASLTVFGVSGPAIAQILFVPTDFSGIQSAIDATVGGDTVVVEDGTYVENIDFRGKAIVVGSRFVVDGDTAHISATVIDGSQPSNADSASVVRFVSGEDSTSVLAGLTVTGGSGTVTASDERTGGGILCLDSAPRLDNLRVVDNGLDAALAGGGGIGCVNRNGLRKLILSKLLVSDNSVDADDRGLGGGILATGFDVELTDSDVSGNVVNAKSLAEGGGVHLTGDADVVNSIAVERSRFVQNALISDGSDSPTGGGALALGDGLFTIRDNTISGNRILTSFGGGAGIAILLSRGGPSVVGGNELTGNRCMGVNCTGAGAAIVDCRDLHVIGNSFTGNHSTGTGGGLTVVDGEATIQGNLIAHNVGDQAAGGVWLEHIDLQESAKGLDAARRAYRALAEILEDGTDGTDGPDGRPVAVVVEGARAVQKGQSRKQILVNNTIAANSSGGLGSGVFTVLSSPQILNSIVWGNSSPNPDQIAGGAAVSYSLVEGGYPGPGNLDGDPMFADQTDFLLMPGSPAVDAGHPDTTYSDPEDSANPGSSLAPALGSTRNDMGAYGGPNSPVAVGAGFLGPQFAAFIAQLDAVPFPERAAIADSFFQAAGSLPFIEDDRVVYFILRGNAGSVHIAGDFNGWEGGIHPMTHRSDVGFWYREEVFESDARIDYKYIRNGNDWILDPHNPNTVPGGFGANSELAMPLYEQPEEIVARPEVPRGATESFEVTSAIRGNTRRVSVHLPVEYEANPGKHYPVVFFHDGPDYMRFGSTRTVIDNLTADGRIVPLIAVFVPPVDRDNEYAFNATEEYERFVIEELMPLIDSTYRTRPQPKARAMTGPSFGGLITTQICYNHPDVFGLCAPFSPSYWVDDGALMEEILTREQAGGKSGILKDIHWYLDWGTYEISIATTGSVMAAGLRDLGYDVVSNEWPEGHSWGSWRAHQDEFLELWFAPGAIVAAEDETAPTQFGINGVYPNPLTDRATISFALDRPEDVILSVFDVTGRRVANLLSQRLNSGAHQAVWRPESQASGIYLIRLQTENLSEVRKVVLVR